MILYACALVLAAVLAAMVINWEALADHTSLLWLTVTSRAYAHYQQVTAPRRESASLWEAHLSAGYTDRRTEKANRSG